MDALDAAVVDIARLIASGRVLRSADPHLVRRKTIRRRRKLSAELRMSGSARFSVVLARGAAECVAKCRRAPLRRRGGCRERTPCGQQVSWSSSGGVE